MESPWTCIGTLETSGAIFFFLMDDCKQGNNGEANIDP